MEKFHNFSLKEGSRVKVILRSGDEPMTIQGEFKGLSDTFQPLYTSSMTRKNIS